MTMYLVDNTPDDPHDDADTTPAGSPRHDLLAEQAVLGGMMFDRDTVGDVCAALQPRDYYRPAHETIHGAIVRLFTRGEPTDPISVTAELTKTGDLARAGGTHAVHGCLEVARTAGTPDYFATLVHEQAVLRRLVQAGQRIAAMGTAGEGNVAEIVDAAQSELFAVAEQRADEEMLRVADTMEAHLDLIESRKEQQGKLIGVPTGFADLDALTGGFRPGQMIVVAARPAMGKSTFALDVARSAAVHHQLPTVVFSLEMDRAEILDRLLSAEAKVALHHIRTGNMTDDDWTRIARYMPAINAAPLYIDASSNLTGMDIRTKARRLAQKHQLGLVVVDYLQLMNSGGAKAENRQLEVSEISRGLKTLAKELGVPVIALSQLNRGPEQRQDKIPVVSDLRESGSIEQDADCVMFVYRESYYLGRAEPREGTPEHLTWQEEMDKLRGVAEVILGKQRHGPIGTVKLSFNEDTVKFGNLARDAYHGGYESDY